MDFLCFIFAVTNKFFIFSQIVLYIYTRYGSFFGLCFFNGVSIIFSFNFLTKNYTIISCLFLSHKTRFTPTPFNKALHTHTYMYIYVRVLNLQKIEQINKIFQYHFPIETSLLKPFDQYVSTNLYLDQMMLFDPSPQPPWDSILLLHLNCSLLFHYFMMSKLEVFRIMITRNIYIITKHIRKYKILIIKLKKYSSLQIVKRKRKKKIRIKYS